MKYIRTAPNVEYSTDRDFFLENQIVCIVGREGTKFCSLIENRLFMRSQYSLLKKSGNPYAVARLFSIFAGLSQKRKL